MKVQATAVGYYNNARIKVGTIFDLVAPKDQDGNPVKVKKVGESGHLEEVELTDEMLFSDRWMDKVDADVEQMALASAKTRPARVQQAPDARDVDRVIQEQLGDKAVAYSGGSKAAFEKRAPVPSGATDGVTPGSEQDTQLKQSEAQDGPPKRGKK